MKKLLFFFILFSGLILTPFQVSATHIMGGEVTWECNGSNQYVFTFKTYRDCSGTANGGPSNSGWRIYNYPNIGQITNLTLDATKNINREIAPACNPSVGTTYSCAAGDPEVVFEYIRVMQPITLTGTPPPGGWIVFYTQAARNSNDNLLGGATANAHNITIRAKIYSHSGAVASQCRDDSPTFREEATSLLCAGTTFTYNHNATDDELDSLVYEWTPPLNGFSGSVYNEGTNPRFISFEPAYSFNNPFPGPEFLNSSTGEITLTPSSGGKYVSAVKVTAYKCGERVAEIYRELQSVISNNCSANNDKPVIRAPFQDPSGNFTLFSDTVRAGDLVTFNIQTTDFPAAGQTVFDSVYSTSTGLQWGTGYTSTTGCNNPPCATVDYPFNGQKFLFGDTTRVFSWQTDCNHVSFTDRCISGQNTYTFVITALDDNCPIPALNIATISITVVGDTVIESPTVNCVDVLPNGDVTLNWDLTPNINSSFTAWMIYSATDRNGPFILLDSVKTYSTNTYTHVGAGANNQQMHYVVRSRSGCKGIVQNIAKDTVSTIYLSAQTNPTNVGVNWNSLTTPNPPGSASQYQLFREYPVGGGLGLYQSTSATSITENFTPCTDNVNYRVDLPNTTKGCTSRSNVLNYTFKFPDPQTNFTFPNNQCPGANISFTNATTITGGSITYVWDFGDGSATSSLTNPIHSYSTAGTYNVSLTATSGKGCDSTLVKPITITFPTADAGINQSICPGGSVIIGGTPTTASGNTVLWSPSSGLNNTGSQNPTATPANTTTYTVTVTDINGCTNTDQVTVTVIPFPSADAGNNRSICTGGSTTIGGSPTGPAGATYNWSPSSGLSATNIANPIATPVTNTTYTVTVTVGSGTTCTATDQVTVTVNPLPTADAGVNRSICLGGSVQIGGSPTSTTSGATYSWSNAASLTSSTSANPIANPTSTTTYTVTVTDGNNCSITDQVTVTVNNLPTANAGSDQQICGTGTVNIGGSPTGLAGATFAWSPSTGLSSTTAANPTASPTVTTTYTVTVTDANGCSNTDQVVVVNGNLPVVDAGNNQSICAGGSTSIGGSPTGPVNSTFAWSPATGLSSTSVSNPIANPTSTTTYTVTVTATNGCTATDNVTITTNPLPVVDAGINRTICNGSSVQIGGSPTTTAIGASYAWSPSTGLSSTTVANPIANPTVTTSYSVTVTDGNGCSNTDVMSVIVNNNPLADAGNNQTICSGQSITIGGSPTGGFGSTYQWDNIGTLNSGTIANPSATPSVTTTYTVTVTNGVNCTAVDQVTITVIPIPTVDAGPDHSYCSGGSVQIGGAPTSTTPGVTYQWDNIATLSSGTAANPIANPTTTTSYTVVVTHPNGCTASDVVVVNVNSLPIADAGPDVSVCNGKSVQIGGSPTGPTGSTFQWDNVATLSSSTASNPMANPTVNTTYTVTVTDINNGCTAVDQVLVSVNALPIVDAGVDKTICENENTILGGTPTGPGGTNFLWNNAGTLNDATLANPTANPIATTTYTVTVTDVAGCSQTDMITITVNPIPAADAGTDQTICNGLPVQIGGSPTSSTVGATFLWDNGGSLSSTNVANPTANPSVNTTYTVTVTHPNGCTNTDAVNVIVNGLPIADAGTNQTICNGGSTPIGGNPTGPTGATYQWDNTTTLNDATLSNPTANPLVNTTYTVTVTDMNGCTNTDIVVVTVNDLPTVDAGPNQTICEGDSVGIGGTPTSTTSGATYQWDNQSTLTNALIANPTANPVVTTNYSVTVTHPNGCTAADVMTVVVNPAPVTDAGSNTSICLRGSIQIGGAPTGPVGSTFQWDNVGTLSSGTTANPIATPLSTTTYSVTVTDINGCTNTDNVIINVNNLPVADGGADQTICSGQNIAIGGAPTGPLGSTFLWDNSASLNDATSSNPTANPTSTTNYTVTVTDINGCTNTDQVTVTVLPLANVDAGPDKTICNLKAVTIGGTPTSTTAGVTYSWDNTTSLNNPNIANPIANPTVTTIYTVTVTHPNLCTATDQVTVVVNTLPAVDAGPNQDICLNASTTIGGSPTGPIGSTYMWDNVTSLNNATLANPIATPTVNTIYSVTVTDANGCTGTDQITVNVNQLPSADAGPDLTICNTQSTTLGGSPTSTAAGASFIWDNVGTLNNSTASNPVATPSTTTTYTVTVTDANACSNTDQITITVNPIPVVDFNHSNTCINELTQFMDASTISSGALQSWFWDFGDGIGTSTQQNPAYQYTTAGNYSVKLIVNSTLGCRDSITKIITINPIPFVDFTTANFCLNAITQFTDQSSISIGSLQSWNWDFGDGSGTSILQNPTYTYSAPGVYNVKLVVESAFGCKDSTIKVITINALPTADAGPDAIICNSGNVTIGGSPTSTTSGVSYTWNNSATLSSSTIANPIANPIITTTYTVTVTELATGCTNTDQVTVTVNPTPMVDFNFNMTCFNDITQFTDASSITVGTLQSWTWDFGDGSGTSSLQNPTYQYGIAGNYTVKLIVESALGCKDSISKVVIINPLPVVDAGADQTICNTQGVNLGGSPTSTATGALYAWDNAASLNNPTDPNPLANPTSTTTYTVTVTDVNGCSETDQITITVNPLPTVDFNSTKVCLNEATQFNDASSINLPSTITNWNWNFGDGVGTSNIQNPQYTYAAAGIYSVKLIVTSNLGCIDSISKNVVVDTLPLATAGLDQLICELDTTQLGKPAITGETYQWDNFSSLSSNNSANPKAFPLTTTTYTVTVTNGNGCSSTDDVTVTVNPSPNVDAGSDKIICRRDTITIGGNPTSSTIGVSYLWNNANTLDDATLENPRAFPSDTTTYVVTITDGNGCTSQDSVIVFVNPLANVDFKVDALCEGDFAAFTDLSSIIDGNLINWTWDFGDGIGTSNLQNPGYQYMTAGSYDVMLKVFSDRGCEDSITKTIVINQVPMADAGGDKEICFGDAVQLGSNPTGPATATFRWSPAFDLSSNVVPNPEASPLSTTVYYLEVIGTNGCANYDTLEVKVNPLPVILAEVDTSLCVDQPVQLEAKGAQTYSWSPQLYLDNPLISNPVTRALKNTEYVVYGTDANGCISTDTVNIEVFNVDFTTPDTMLCSGDSILLVPILQGDTNGITYSWTPNTGINAIDIYSPKVSPSNEMYYYLQINNSLGCTDNDSIKVTFFTPPALAFEYLNSPRCAGSMIEIQNGSTSTGDYIWKLNGEIVSTEVNPKIYINNLVDNEITLIGGNSNCSDSLIKIIPAEELGDLLKLKNANVFTPNGDGINDIFDPGFEGEFIGCVNFRIYDRWGNKVFDSNIGQYGWDGITLRGQKAPNGVYYYFITIAGEQIKGSVYLNR